ncbi:hypothetical protein [Thermogemmatispora sp.]|uniref:hypothetical protein n=1 Tax=Thermogemmatispora sp. TaxID=1968838 RepID=UPI001E01D748|nr:hypothetical protein [Thermogemmatispora sp.]MBX5451601.1 hypothetical protein [Thermogemmatispora sp.]
MAKKAGARGGARQKARAQKHIELVRQVGGEQANAPSHEGGAASQSKLGPKATVAAQARPEETREQEQMAAAAAAEVSRPASAASKLASRRQVSRAAQRSAALITPEHYAYVRRDLVMIAILAAIMFATLIVLHFVPALGG